MLDYPPPPQTADTSTAPIAAPTAFIPTLFPTTDPINAPRNVYIVVSSSSELFLGSPRTEASKVSACEAYSGFWSHSYVGESGALRLRLRLYTK
jgi:hypothetical protein